MRATRMGQTTAMTSSPAAVVEVRHWLSKLPWPVAFILSAAAMLAGPVLLSIGAVDPPQVQAADGAMKAAPAWLLLLVGALVPALEAIVWCMGFIEGAHFVARRPALGALLGAMAYGVAYHHAYDLRTIAAATWVAAVINVSYLALREQSRGKALLWAIGLRWVFAGLGVLSYRGII